MSRSNLQRRVVLILIGSAALLFWRGVPRPALTKVSPVAAARLVAAAGDGRGGVGGGVNIGLIWRFKIRMADHG